ncbi:MAG: amidohydrolase family protein [Boseongicola sp.]|nr:MAG: amidohydrolase family protein [Boseongicola sp.]
MTRIDAHQHFWALERGDYGWLTPELKTIYRDFLPNDLAPLLANHGINGTVLVQAAPTVAETCFMLSLADETPFIKGVVGWVDFEDPAAPETIADLAADDALVGLRPMIQDIEDVDWMLRDDLAPVFQALINNDLTFDALTLPPHLPNLKTLLSRHPDMRVVIDHASKPFIRDQITEGWAQDMTDLAGSTSAYCKVSGMVTEAAENWTTEDLKPYVDHLLTCFGPDRLIWGSDWPVCTLAATYDQWAKSTTSLLEGLSPDEIAAIMGGNARAAYKLPND